MLQSRIHRTVQISSLPLKGNMNGRLLYCVHFSLSFSLSLSLSLPSPSFFLSLSLSRSISLFLFLKHVHILIKLALKSVYFYCNFFWYVHTFIILQSYLLLYKNISYFTEVWVEKIILDKYISKQSYFWWKVIKMAIRYSVILSYIAHCIWVWDFVLLLK